MRKLKIVLIIAIAAILVAGTANAYLSQYWKTIDDIVPRTNESRSIGSATKFLLKLWTKDIHVSGDLTDGTNTLTVANAKSAHDHVSADGSSHSFINQNVTSGSAPTFTANNFSDGGSNAIITTTQETNFETAYTNRITSATVPLDITSNTISIPIATISADGYLSSTDWDTFNSKSNLALGESSTTAYRGDRGKTAYDYSQIGHLPLTGGTLSGALDMGSNLINNLADPLASGDAVNFGTLLEIVAGGNFDFFLNNTLSGITEDGKEYFEMDVHPTGEAESEFDEEITSDAGTIIDSFITPTGEPTFTTISAGIYSFHFHATATVGVTIETVRSYYEFWKRTALGVETLIATSEESDVLTGTKTSYNVHCIHDELTIGATDLLLIKVYGIIEDDTGSRVNHSTITLYAEGVNATRFSATTTISAFDARYVEVAGDTMSGALDMGTNNITGLGTIATAAGTLTIDETESLTSYLTSTRADTWLGTKSTTDLSEGTNKYYTDARARASISETVTGLSYDSGTGVLSLTANYVIPTTTQETNWDGHLGSDGSSHTFLDQSVISGANVIFGTIGSGAITTTGDLTLPQYIKHTGDADTHIAFGTDTITFTYGGTAVTAANIATNNDKVTESTSVTSPLVLTDYDISIPVATSSANGYLSSGNWTTFNSKSDLALGETDSTAYRGDRGKSAYDHISADGSSHSFLDQSVISGANVTFGTIGSGAITSTGDIHTTGAGDDLWLGNATQASADWRAYTDGRSVTSYAFSTADTSFVSQTHTVAYSGDHDAGGLTSNGLIQTITATGDLDGGSLEVIYHDLIAIHGVLNDDRIIGVSSAGDSIPSAVRGSYNFGGSVAGGSAIVASGVQGSASGNMGTDGSTNKRGGTFSTSGTADFNYGIYTSANGATINRAVYADGDIETTGDIYIPAGKHIYFGEENDGVKMHYDTDTNKFIIEDW